MKTLFPVDNADGRSNLRLSTLARGSDMLDGPSTRVCKTNNEVRLLIGHPGDAGSRQDASLGQPHFIVPARTGERIRLMKANQKKGVIAPTSGMLELEETVYKAMFMLDCMANLLVDEFKDHHHAETGDAKGAGLWLMSIELQMELRRRYEAAIEQWKRDSRN